MQNCKSYKQKNIKNPCNGIFAGISKYYYVLPLAYIARVNYNIGTLKPIWIEWVYLRKEMLAGSTCSEPFMLGWTPRI